MSNEEHIKELYRAHSESQSKYTYFLLAAAGASIAFAVQKTEGLLLSWWLLPVGLAALSWIISFYCGCKNIIWVQTALMANYGMLQLKAGNHPNQPLPNALDAAIEGTREALRKNADKAQFYAICQFRCLVLGALFFIVWRVTEILRLTFYFY